MVAIKSYTKLKDKNSNGTGGTGGGAGYISTVASRLKNTRLFWGNPFNGTQDVDGPIKAPSIEIDGSTNLNGNLNVSGKSIFTDDLIVDGSTNLNGNLKVSGTTKLDENLIVDGSTNLNGELNVSGESTFKQTINSKDILPTDNLAYNLGSGNLQWKKIFGESAFLKDLTVTGKAHFFELIIDKIKSAGGAVIFTPTNGFNVDIIEPVTDGYKLYWLVDDGSGNLADNMWKVNDLAICMSFNQAKDGASHNISNKYYWSLVTAVSDTNQPVSIEEKKYHYIVISTVTKDGTVNPEIGDTIAMLGYRGTDDKKRQSAIYISAYTSLDKGLTAPLLALYLGINDFNLESHRKSYFDASGAKFVGNFEVSNGLTIEDYVNEKLNDVEAAGAPYIGSDGYWYVWDNTLKKYVKTNTKAEGKDGNSINIKGETVGHYRNWAALVKDSSVYIDINEEILLDDSSDWSETNALDGTVYTGFKKPTVMRYVSAPDHNYDAFAASIGDCYIDKDGCLWIATDSQWNNVGKIKGEDGKDGINGTNGTNGTNGKDAEFYKLLPVLELAVVDKNGTLGISLMYNIRHIKGADEFAVSASTSDYYVRFKPNTSSSYTNLSVNTITPIYTNTSYQTNYHKQSTKIEYLTILLVSSGGLVKDTRVVPVQFAASATLEITDSIKTTVLDNTTSITDLAGKVLTNTNNISTVTLKANSIESKVTSNTTTINNLSGSVTSLQSDMSDVKQTAESITSTVSSMKDEIIGENCMLGLNGQGWSSNTIYEDAGTSFHCESTDWFQSHPIADFSGDYTFSFGVWGGGIQIKILEFTQTYYDDGIYNKYVDFGTYTPCKILTTSSSVSNANLTNYATSGTSSTWTYTNTETITLAVGDNVAVRVTNSTNNRYNSIYGTVSAINTSSKSVTVTAIKLLDQPNTICTLSCPADKKDGTDINSLHYDEKLGRWWIRFKESSGAAKTFVILFRNPSTSIIGYISRLMIEESVEYPHKYNSTGQASQSMIKQTAESIMMNVNNTYVKIGDGNITLNGDTKVNGSLTLNDEDQGFLLLGDSGTTEISPKSIGTYNEFKSKTTNTIKTHFNSTIYGSPTVDGALYGFSWNVSQKLGTFKKGSYIRVIDYINVAFANVGTLQYSIGTPSATFYIHENGTLTKTITVGNKTSVDIGNYTVVGDNVEVMVTGRFTVQASQSIWGTSQDILSPRDTIQPIKPMPSITVNVDWKNEVPTSSGFMLIGYDGFAVNFGNNKTVYCGADGFIASYGVNEFRITSDGIWRNNHPNIKVLKGTDNSNSPATYTVQEPVDTVLCTGNYCKIIFPPNPYEGQTFRILDKALEETYINSNGKKVVNHKTGGDGKVLNPDYLGGQVFWTYVYIDGRWYESAES